MIRNTRALVALCMCLSAGSVAAQERQVIVVEPAVVAWLQGYVLKAGTSAKDSFGRPFREMDISTPIPAACGRVHIEAHPPRGAFREPAIVIEARCALPYRLKDRTITVTGQLMVSIHQYGQVLNGLITDIDDDGEKASPAPEALRQLLNETLQILVAQVAGLPVSKRQ